MALKFVERTKEEKKQAEVEVGSAIDVDIGRPISPNVLSQLGDDIYKIVNYGPIVLIVLRYSSYSWYEPATAILKEFYNSVDREPPEWIDLLAEQTIVQETSEEKQFELRGYIIIV
jgi:hypothetical protein